MLTIEKSNVYSYGKGSGIVSNDKHAKILHSFIELCGSVDEAKAKAEELLPLFESIGLRFPLVNKYNGEKFKDFGQ